MPQNLYLSTLPRRSVAPGPKTKFRVCWDKSRVGKVQPQAKSSLFLQIKFYWNMAIAICLCLTAFTLHQLLSNWCRNYLAHKSYTIFVTWPFSLPRPHLDNTEFRFTKGRKQVSSSFGKTSRKTSLKKVIIKLIAITSIFNPLQLPCWASSTK